MGSEEGWVLITVQAPTIMTPAAAAPCCWPLLVLRRGSEVAVIPFLCTEPGSATETLPASLRNTWLRVYDPQTFSSQYSRKLSVKTSEPLPLQYYLISDKLSLSWSFPSL